MKKQTYQKPFVMVVKSQAATLLAGSNVVNSIANANGEGISFGGAGTGAARARQHGGFDWDDDWGEGWMEE